MVISVTGSLVVQVYRSETDDYVYFNKEYGRSVSVSGALDGMYACVLALDGMYVC